MHCGKSDGGPSRPGQKLLNAKYAELVEETAEKFVESREWEKK
jgi:hypothetical protein